MRRLVIAWGLAAASLAALAQAPVPAAPAVSLEDCLQRALEKNLDLRIARYEPLRAQTDLQAAFAGYNPALTLGGGHQYSKSGGGFSPEIGAIPATTTDEDRFEGGLSGLAPLGLQYRLQGNVSESRGKRFQPPLMAPFDSANGLASLSLAQPLLKNLWIDQTRFHIRVARNRIQYTELGLQQAIMNTVTAVEKAYYDLVSAHENVAVQEKAVELAAQSLKDTQRRREVGTVADLEVKQAEAQAASTQAALIAARSALAVQQNNLQQLITDDYAAARPMDLRPAAALGAPARVLDKQLSWGKGLRQRPDLLQARLDLDRQGILLKYHYNQLFPELDLVGSYGHGAGGAGISEFSQAFHQINRGNRPFYSYGAQLTFPLGNSGARAAYKKSKLEKEQLLLALKRLEQDIMVAIDNDINRARSSYQQVAATRAAREYAQAALEAEQIKSQAGSSILYLVLQMQRDLTAARGNEIQALAAYNKTLTQLSLDEGSTLERLGIHLELK